MKEFITNVLLQYYQAPVLDIESYNDNDVLLCFMQFYNEDLGWVSCIELLRQYIEMKKSLDLPTDVLVEAFYQWKDKHEGWMYTFETQIRHQDVDYVVEEVERARVCYENRTNALIECKQELSFDHEFFLRLNEDFLNNVNDEDFNFAKNEDGEYMGGKSKFDLLLLFSIMFRRRRQEVAHALILGENKKRRLEYS